MGSIASCIVVMLGSTRAAEAHLLLLLLLLLWIEGRCIHLSWSELARLLLSPHCKEGVKVRVICLLHVQSGKRLSGDLLDTLVSTFPQQCLHCAGKLRIEVLGEGRARIIRQDPYEHNSIVLNLGP